MTNDILTRQFMPFEEINNLIYKNLQLICIFIIMP